MNLRPLYDRIVVRRIEQKEQVQGGIIIPDSAKEKPQEGEVVAVGKGKRLEDGSVVPLDLKAGDRILFGKYSGSDIKMGFIAKIDLSMRRQASRGDRGSGVRRRYRRVRR
jgi:chaperonin GroES